MKIINGYRKLDAHLGRLLLTALDGVKVWLGPGTTARHRAHGTGRGRRWHVARHGRDQALTVVATLRRLDVARYAEALLAA